MAAIHAVQSKHGTEGLAGVDVGVPGFIDMKSGVIAAWGNMPSFNGYPVRDAIGKELGKPVILENDANAAALGEKWMGAGRDVDDLVMLTLGTGVGWRDYCGRENPPWEFGNGRRTRASHGGAEREPLRLRQQRMRGEACLGDCCLGAGPFDASEREPNLSGCLRARRGRQRTGTTIFRYAGESLGIALANLINIFNFPLFLIGGGPLPAWEFFAPAMMAEVERRSQTYRLTKQMNVPTRIEKAILGNESGLYGAAYLPFQAQS